MQCIARLCRAEFILRPGEVETGKVIFYVLYFLLSEKEHHECNR
jgi:hypothetical protein